MNAKQLERWLGPHAGRRVLLHAGLFLAAVLFAILLPYFYVGAEHYFYSWDWALYKNMATAETAAFQASPVWAVDSVMQSLGGDYNRIFTAPIAPLLAVLGTSQRAYIISLSLIYMLPFALVLGALATRLISATPWKVFWSTTALALLMPTIWASTLQGWPDVGAACLIALALGVHLENRFLTRRAKIVLIGLLAVAAMLFRRQYAYDAVALYGALGLQAIVHFGGQLRRDRTAAFRGLLDSAVYIGLAGVVSLVALVLVGWPFLFHVLGHNYLTLYSSYELPLRTVIGNYALQFGLGVCVLAIAGYVAGLRTHMLRKEPAILLLSYGGVSCLEWLAIVRQTGFHYALHFGLLIVLGLSSIFWIAWTRTGRNARAVLAGALLVFLALNFGNGLATKRFVTNRRMRPIFANNTPPLRRNDYNDVVQLVGYLRKVTDSKPIYVVASNLILNFDMVKNAERAIYGPHNTKLRVMTTPEVDSRDFYPVAPLLKADYVVLARPFQHHLKQQEVVRSVYDAFTENWAISKDFVRLPAQFYLEHGVTVSVYRRIRATSPRIALQTLLRTQNLVGQKPGGQSGWLVLGQLTQSDVVWSKVNTYSIRTFLFNSENMATTSFAYPEKLPAHTTISGTIEFRNEHCPGVRLQLATVNRQGDVTDLTDIPRHPTGAPAFDSSLETNHAEDLLLTVRLVHSGDHAGYCALRINNLQVSQYHH